MISLAAVTAVFLMAGPTNNMTFRPKMESVSIFRDGYGYFVKEGKVKLENGWATANFLPKAIDGTVWVYSSESGANVDEVVATHSNSIAFKDAASLKAALADKIGLSFTITMNNGQTFSGGLNRLLDDMLLLDNGSGFSGLPYGSIQKVVLDGYPLKVHVSGVSANSEISLKIAYLQEGVRWQPSYVLSVKNGTGNLQLRASLQNSVQDLDGVKLNFVVGSPFVTQRGMGDLLGSVAPEEAAHGASVDLGKKDKDDLRAVDPDAQPSQAPQMGAGTSVDQAGELYYYSMPEVNLAKGDVAMMTLAEQTIPVTPEFDWNADGDTVKYLIKFKNTLKEPLTSGAVLVIDDGKALGQDTLSYVPSGGDAKLSLAQGIGIRVTHNELESKRAGTVHIGKDDFIPVTMEGTLKVEDHRSAAINISIVKTIRGKVLSISDGGTITNTQVLNGEVNTVNSAKWSLKVDPGQVKVIHYTYLTYVSASAAGSPPVPIMPNDLP